MSPKQNPQIPEGINTSDEHPLKEFALLVTGIGITLVLLMFALGFMAKHLAHHIPFQWEPKLSFATEEIHPYPEAQQALEDILSKLVQTQANHDITYDIHLLDSDIPNAFATLGGQIYVNTGLLKHVESENGLAMVIAHEMAHVSLRHPIKAFSQNAVFQLITTMVFGDTAITGIASHTGILTFLSFSRDMEREADKLGKETLIATYGHAGGAAEFFESMEKEGENTSEFLATHPNVENRLASLNQPGGVASALVVLKLALRSLKTPPL